MPDKSALAIISLGFLCHQFCHLQAVPFSNEELASAFQIFSKKAATEMLEQKRDLQKLYQALGPLMDRFKNGTKSTDSNEENIRMMERDLESLRSAVEANKRNLEEARMATSQCGGFIKFDGKEELLYKIPPGVSYVNCIWVLWAEHGGPIRMKNEPDAHAEFDSSFQLIAAENFTSKGRDFTPLPSGIEKVLKSYYGFALIFFRANMTRLGQGFHLKFEDTGSSFTRPLKPKFKTLSLSEGNGTLKYPPGLSYGNNERVFAIGQVPEGKSLNVKINRRDTESYQDWFRIMWLDSTMNSWQYTGLLTYGFYPHTYLVPGGCSYIFIFISDARNTGSGIQMSYNVIESNIM